MAEDLNSLLNNHDRRLRNLETRQVKGIAGAQGTTGIQGYVGSVGVQGTVGPQGIQGRQGIQGVQGFGFAQLQGIQGIQGITGATGAGGAIGYYGAFSDYNDHYAGVGATGGTPVANTAAPFTFNTTDEANGISITQNGSGLNSRITFANVGTYNVQFSAQIENTGNADQDIYVWFRKNGVDIPGSTGTVGLEPKKDNNNPYHTITGWNFVFTTTAPNDYYEFYWSTTSTDVSIQYYSIADNGSPTKPSTASIVLTATQVTYTIQGTQGIQGVGVPSGGTAGQVLAKNSSSNYDTSWQTRIQTYIQSSAPVVSLGDKYLWWDTSEETLTLWIEDGT